MNSTFVTKLTVFCTIHNPTFYERYKKKIQNMINLKTLDIADNAIIKLKSSLFQSMFHLELLNLSNNSLSSLPAKCLHSLKHLRYFYIQNNHISFIHPRTFYFSRNLRVLIIRSNLLKYFDETFAPKLPALLLVSSDVHRLCCVFEKAANCSPSFPPFVSC